VLRLFDGDGSGSLNFKEFLCAVDVANCRSEAAKLE
jgi:Ca2+-binding EF-hand superfamily protein